MKTGRKYGEKEKIQILIKSLIYRILRIYIFSFYAFLFFVSFSDAKIFKDVLQCNVCVYFACDIRQVVDAFAEILADEVGG